MVRCLGGKQSGQEKGVGRAANMPHWRNGRRRDGLCRLGLGAARASDLYSLRATCAIGVLRCGL